MSPARCNYRHDLFPDGPMNVHVDSVYSTEASLWDATVGIAMDVWDAAALRSMVIKQSRTLTSRSSTSDED